jgi:acid phosphatase type 7
MENKSSSELTMGLQAQYLTSNPGYMGYKNAGCGKRDASGSCQARTCAATLTFHVVNFRTNVEFVLFSGGFRTPCLLKRSGALQFTNPAKPLYGHLSSTDSEATSVRTTSLGVSPFHLAFSFYKFTTWVFFVCLR